MNQIIKRNGDKIINNFEGMDAMKRFHFQLFLQERRDNINAKASGEFTRGYQSALDDLINMIAQSASNELDKVILED